MSKEKKLENSLCRLSQPVISCGGSNENKKQVFAHDISADESFGYKQMEYIDGSNDCTFQENIRI